MILPFSILPFVLAGCFLLIWAFVAEVEYEENLTATRYDREAPSRAVY
jgi:hypothetical protein